MKIQNLKTSSLFVLCAFLLAGCATSPEIQNTSAGIAAHPGQITSAPGDQANIFVHRDAQLSGAALTLTVFFDGATAGTLKMGDSMEIQAPPGDHLLGISVGEMTRMTSISVEAGRNYYYRFHAGLTRLKDPEPVSESEGRSWSGSSDLKAVYQATTTSAVARIKREGGTLSKADAMKVVQDFLSGGTLTGFTWDKATVTEAGIDLQTTTGVLGNGPLPSQASGSAETSRHLTVNSANIIGRENNFALKFADVAEIKTNTTLVSGDYLLFYDRNGSKLLSIPCGNKFPNFDILIPALHVLCPNAKPVK